MENESVEIKIDIPIKVIKKAYAYADLDIPADAEIIEMFSNYKLDVSRLPGEDGKRLQFGLSLFAVGLKDLS